MFPIITTINGSTYENSDCERLAFIAKYKNTICLTERYTTSDSLFDVMENAKEYLKCLIPDSTDDDIFFDGFDSDTIILQGKGIQIIFFAEDKKILIQKHGIINITMSGFPHIIKPLLQMFTEKYHVHQQGQLQLWYKGNNGTTYMNIPLMPYGTFHPEFYPWLPCDFIDEYMNSPAAILFLTGEPGTGKTSIIRSLVCSRGLTVSATYDEKTLEQDEMFLNFITSDKINILIIEDADNILHSREEAKNPLISRFLNFSEGLAKFPKKKIIFTTNLHNFQHVDEALTRSGRCFGVLTARKLSFDEVKIVAEIAKVPVPDIVKSYTLSDVLNQDQRYKIRRSATGFEPNR